MLDEANPETGADAAAFDDEALGVEDLAARLEAEEGQSDDARSEDDPETDDGDAAQADADADGEDGATAEDTEKGPEVRRFKVNTPDGEIEVDEAELVRGYQRLSDYSRNIQKVKAVQAELSSIASEAGTVGHRAALGALMQSDPLLSLEGSAELAELRATDPGEYAALQADMQERRRWWGERLGEIDEAAAKARKALTDREADALRAAVPEISDPAKAQAWLSDVVSVGREFGMSEADMDAVTDHRFVLMAKAYADLKRKVDARETVTAQVAAKRVAAPSMPAGAAKSARSAGPRDIKQTARVLSGRDNAAARAALQKLFD